MKTAQLQIRLSPAQKVLLQRRARQAGQDVSGYVLSRLIPDDAVCFAKILAGLEASEDRRFALAELSDFLAQLPPSEFERAVTDGLPNGLSSLERNLFVDATVGDRV